MELNIARLILDAGPVVKLVMLILVFFSVVSWGIILTKFKSLKNKRKTSLQFIDFFWKGSHMEEAFKKANQLKDCPTANVFRIGYSEYRKLTQNSHPTEGAMEFSEISESLERALNRAILTEIIELEKRTPFLATTSSATPFIGLFGTVWGIMNSFLNIGAKGATNLAVVAPGISEALIATALGLFAAIPAVIGYNYCLTQIRFLQREMETFSSDFLNALKRAHIKK